MVKAVYSREEYHLMRMKEEIDRIYNGKLGNFVAAFTKENGIDRKEAKELIELLEKY